MGRVLLNGKNLLSVTKVICQQSLTCLYYLWLYVNNLSLSPLFTVGLADEDLEKDLIIRYVQAGVACSWLLSSRNAQCSHAVAISS